jgi:hypothetical protein
MYLIVNLGSPQDGIISNDTILGRTSQGNTIIGY